MTFTTDTIFLGIVLICAIMGMFKGFIRTIGGLIAMVISGIGAKVLCVPITKWIFSVTSIEHKISSALHTAGNGISQSIGAATERADNINNIISSFNRLGWGSKIKVMPEHIPTLPDAINISALNVTSIFVAFILFAILMFVCGMLVNLFHDAFITLPLGKTVNNVAGGACGVLKGLIIAFIVYYLFIGMNAVGITNIQLDDSFMTNILNMIKSSGIG